jgi:hypothetical protein
LGWIAKETGETTRACGLLWHTGFWLDALFGKEIVRGVVFLDGLDWRLNGLLGVEEAYQRFSFGSSRSSSHRSLVSRNPVFSWYKLNQGVVLKLNNSWIVFRLIVHPRWLGRVFFLVLVPLSVFGALGLVGRFV